MKESLLNLITAPDAFREIHRIYEDGMRDTLLREYVLEAAAERLSNISNPFRLNFDQDSDIPKASWSSGGYFIAINLLYRAESFANQLFHGRRGSKLGA